MNLQKSIIELVKNFYNNTVKLWLDVCILEFVDLWGQSPQRSTNSKMKQKTIFIHLRYFLCIIFYHLLKGFYTKMRITASTPCMLAAAWLTRVVIGSLSGRVCRQLVTQKISGYTESPADMLMLKQDSHSSFSSHPDLICFFVLLQNIICVLLIVVLC